MRNERGAVAIMVALVMVPLLGFAALSLDVGGMWWEKQKLQTAADAGALAIAQDCGRSAPACNTFTTTAQTLANANHPGTPVTATVPDKTTSKVTVKTAAPRKHHFAPALGLRDSRDLTAQATVGWGAPSGGTALLPLTFSLCEFLAQTGGGLPSTTDERTIYFTKSSNTGCTGPSGNAVPGGFGWLKTIDGTTCRSTSTVNQTLMSETGNAVPQGCSVASFETLVNTTVLLPLYDQASDNGTNAWYRLYGYAAFRITGYDFVGKYQWNAKHCKGNEHCVKGYFTRFVSLDESFTYSATAPALGASVVALTS
jgi:Flp pilus assembly protein TadG